MTYFIESIFLVKLVAGGVVAFGLYLFGTKQDVSSDYKGAMCIAVVALVLLPSEKAIRELNGWSPLSGRSTITKIDKDFGK